MLERQSKREIEKKNRQSERERRKKELNLTKVKVIEGQRKEVIYRVKEGDLVRTRKIKED